jgi:hypothetical protein
MGMNWEGTHLAVVARAVMVRAGEMLAQRVDSSCHRRQAPDRLIFASTTADPSTAG